MCSETVTQVAGSTSSTGELPQHTPKRIDEFLLDVLKKGGSDLHFVAGDPPRVRLHGALQSLREEPLEKLFVQETILEFITRRAQAQLEEKDGADFAYMIPGVSRFRVNVFRHIGGLGAVFRAIPSKALTLEQLNLPQAVRGLCRVNNGLILVTGKTGSGKSTTLAAMIDDINAREKGHILTIEDPVVWRRPHRHAGVRRHPGQRADRRRARHGAEPWPGRSAARGADRGRQADHPVLTGAAL